MQTVLLANPFRCRVWNQHARIEEYVSEESCSSEIESFETHGQSFPVIARRIQDPGFDFEIICGARRLFVARHLNTKLRVEIRDVSDREAAVLSELENNCRTDISAYERGRAFATWLNSGHFSSQDDIAQTLGFSASQVSRLLKVGRLPAAIVAAFRSPLDISEAWGLELYAIWSDESKRMSLLNVARRLARATEKRSPVEIHELLITSVMPRGERILKVHRDEVVLSVAGEVLFRVRHHNQAVALVINKQKISRSLLNNIKDALAGMLQQEQELSGTDPMQPQPLPAARAIVSQRSAS